MLRLDFTLSYPDFRLQVSETIAPSGITALFGRSGSGKSSLLRVIAGLERHAHGTVVLDGTTLQSANGFVPPHLRNIGYVFQETRLFPHLTVAGNLEYADHRARKHPGPSWADVMQALDLRPLLNRRPETLSGGEKSRVAIGRALLCRPKLLLMDEPLAALDDLRKSEILPYLERLRDAVGTPILYVSHSATEVARLGTHLMLIDAGKITASGPIAQMLSDLETAPALGPRETGAVITALVDTAEADGLTRLATSAGPMLISGITAPKGTPVRLRILAQDVIIAHERPIGLSALNILPVTVIKMGDADGPGVLLQLALGDEHILARVTRRSVDALALAPGTPCFAILKSVSVALSSTAGAD